MSSTWKNGIDKLLHLAPSFQLDAQKAALVIVDVQYGSTHPEHGYGPFIKEKYPEIYAYFYPRLAQIVVPNLVKLISFFRENKLRIIYLTLGSMLPDLSDLTPLRRQRQSRILRYAGSFDYEILEDIKPRQGELVMHKTAGNAFNSSPIDSALRNMGIECLVVTGVATSACVQLTAFDAADRGYKTVIVEDAVAGHNEELSNATLRVFSTIYGRVATTDEVCAELRKQISQLSCL